MTIALTVAGVIVVVGTVAAVGLAILLDAGLKSDGRKFR